jgi:hypothetical protein
VRKESINIDDLAYIQKKIEDYRHFIAAARAGHYSIRADPGQEEPFVIRPLPQRIHEVIEGVFTQAATDIKEELWDSYSVEIGSDE